MKRLSMQIVCIISILLILIHAGGILSVNAEMASLVTSKVFDKKTTTDINKVWTIKFSADVDGKYLGGKDIYILDSMGEIIETKLIVDGNLVMVKPFESYQIGQTYSLHIGRNIKSLNGQMIKKPIVFNFEILGKLDNQVPGVNSDGKKVTEVMNTHHKVETAVRGLKENVTVTMVENIIRKILSTEASIVSVDKYEAGRLEISYYSGIKSTIQIESRADRLNDMYAFNLASNSSSNTEATQERMERSKIPVDEQTWGDPANIVVPSETIFNSLATIKKDLVGSRNVLLWAPFEKEFAFYSEKEQMGGIFRASPVAFNVIEKVGSAADVDSLRKITDYGFILFQTYGAGGKWVVTGEGIKDPKKYEAEQMAGQIKVVQRMIVDPNKGVEVGDPTYAVNDSWFAKNLTDVFDNSIIMNNSYESVATDLLWQQFKAKNAGAYYGFGQIASNETIYKAAVGITNNLVNNYAAVGEAGYIFFKEAGMKTFGNNQLRLAEEEKNTYFTNGSFEQGLSNWESIGDGRVISNLGNITPRDGRNLGIISTGLNQTVDYGSLEQTFYLPKNMEELSFDWNYLSEEFLEYIGTDFNDSFTVTMTTQNGGSTVILHSTVNKLAKQFGAINPKSWEASNNYYENGGKLIPLLEQIKFDRGDVWMTDWQKHTFNIPESLRGETVTLKFSVVDGGDTIFDTAVLIDNIKFITEK